MDKDKRYLKFASTLSFFEFVQEEFYKPRFNINNYKHEISLLENVKSVSERDLTVLISKNPKLFDVFEQLFQFYRFSNVQLINIFFDLEIINSLDEKKTIDYLFENLEKDKDFKDIFDKVTKKNKFSYSDPADLRKKECVLLLKLFKEAIADYIEDISKENKASVYSRLKDDPSSSSRLARYLINNLKLDEMLQSVRLLSYLKNKRIPKDNKSIHGKFGIIKIGKILEELNFLNTNQKFKELNIKILEEDLSNVKNLDVYKGKWIFVTEKYIKDVFKKKQKKPKKFDFIILFDLKIKYAVETNFYSTSGTKIGINEGEYVDLNQELKEKYPNIVFLWITDGNYWLTSDGESRFKNCLDYFEDNLLNYNLLKLKLKGS